MRGGFTFIEILFAVVILGIGMIMIAAFLTAGATQVNLLQRDFAASGAAGQAAAILRSQWQLNPAAFPPASGGSQWIDPRKAAGLTQPFTQNALYSVLGSTVDTRTGLAWIPFYFRPLNANGASGSCQFIVVCVNAFDGSEPTTLDARTFWSLTPAGIPTVSNDLLPARRKVREIVRLDALRYGLRFDSDDEVAVSGALVLFEKDASGRIFRLDEKEGDVWPLSLESDLPVLNPDGIPNNGDETIDTSLAQQMAYVIGRRTKDPSQPLSASNPYSGTSTVQSVAKFVVKG